MKSVLNISDAASLALHAAAYMAANGGGPSSAAEISRAICKSSNHLSKVLQRLAKVGIVTSSHGPSGGYSLAKPASRITFLEVFEAVDGPMGCANCLLGKTSCASKRCIMGGFVADMNKRARAFFNSKKLSEFENWKEFQKAKR